MKAAKTPPSADVRAEAMVMMDAIRDQQGDKYLTQILTLVRLAVAEYLRQFPRARANRAWVPTPLFGRTETRMRVLEEWDYQCLFCRESLNTLPAKRKATAKFLAGLQPHIRECALLVLMGERSVTHPNMRRKRNQKTKATP